MKKSKYRWHGIPVVAMITGSITGGIEAATTWPNEVIKTELQTQTDGRYKGVIDCFKQKVRTQGVLSLYRGLVPIVLGSMPKAGIRFGGYQFAASRLQDENGQMGSLQSIAAGVCAGSTEALFAVTPMETLKTRLINKNKPFISGTADILRNEGLGGLYKGLAPTIAKQSLNQATRFLVYNNYARTVKSYLGKEDIGFLFAVLGGMFSGTCSSLVNQPVDTIKTRMQGVGATKYKSTLDCWGKILAEEGPGAFFKGAASNVIRGTGGALVLVMYDEFKKMI